MKKILFFIPSLAGGGAEKVLINLANHLNKEKYRITIMCLFDYGINKNFLGKDVEYKYIFKKLIKGNTQILKIFTSKFLYKKMIKEEYDVVVSFFQSPTTRIIAGCQNEKTKLVQWIHNEFSSRGKIVYCYRNEKECIELQKKYDATIYVSKTVRDIYLSTFPEIKKKDIVLYNVVESDKILKLSKDIVEEKDLYKSEYTIISVGRFVPQKSFNRLISIIAKIKEQGFDVKLLLLGTGELENNLHKQVEELKIENSVVFLGYKENPYKYVKNADLFVCSSLHEGFSTAVTESLIVGTPVVTTLCSGMKELLGENEYGVITDNNEKSLLEGVVSLLKDKKLLAHYRAKAEERGKKFNMERTVLEVENFFDKL